jgi:hypothetical protein
MGILDRYASDEDKEELVRNLKLPSHDKAANINTDNKTKKAPVSGKKSSEKKNRNDLPDPDDELLSVIHEFVQSYKASDKTGRMIRIQDAHYRELVSLRADGISVSEFISFAVHFTLRSKDYDTIINILKQ